MDTTQIISILSLASGVVVAMFNIIILLIALRKRKNAKTPEEQNASEEIIKHQIELAVANIKSICNANNLMFNTKQTSKIAKKIIKENKNND